MESDFHSPDEQNQVQPSEANGKSQISSLLRESFDEPEARGVLNMSPPNRRPPPLPTAAPLVKSGGPKLFQDPPHLIFRPLERYIITCFTSIDCLNRSFLISKPAAISRAASEGRACPVGLKALSDESTDINNPLPELDAKTLLLGDFAENGIWWTGRSYFERHLPNGSTLGTQEVVPEDRMGSKSSRINWSEVDECYRMIISPGSSWKTTIDRIQQTRKDTLAMAPGFTIPVNLLVEIESEIHDASAHVQRTLLKACENVLRRPGRPLQRPQDCHFLLILMANPLLQASNSAMASGAASFDVSKTENGTGTSKLNISARSSQQPLARQRSLSNKGGVAGKHSGIAKRILGLMANLPSYCHVYLVHWFSQFSDVRFRRLVEIVGSFVTYRLIRQHGRKRSDSPDPHGGLVPDICGPGAGTSAQLHAALGFSTNVKPAAKSEGGSLYSNDWQIRASARVMSLLFAANFQGTPQQQNLTSNGYFSARNGSSSLATLDRAKRRRQILPISSFYNTFLDQMDLVADYEAWEARKGTFSFCQYPMFLSIWAKIRILEHDARRQMEIKAREAFFNSIMSRKAINQYLVLKVRRNCLVEDSLRGVSEVVGTGQDEIKKGLRIQFLGEEGLDSGGLRKEWFLLLIREVFDPEHGLFVYDEDSRYCYFNPDCFETSDQFFLVGVLVGLAIYNSTILDVALPPFAFRKLLASAPNHLGPATSFVRSTMSYTIEDLAEFRPSLASGLKALLDFEGNVQETFCRDFVVVTERYGQAVQAPLCPDGANRPVTNTNRKEFVDLYIRHLLDSSIARQYEPFKRGFFSVCEGNALSLFRPEEIELLVRGSEEPLDVETLRAVAIYDGWGKCASPADEPVVTWFWESFAKAGSNYQRKLLSFITSSDRIPAMGATSLVIKLTCLGEDSGRFPIARTCFNMLGLYRYKAREVLEDKLWRAIAESEGFGMK